MKFLNHKKFISKLMTFFTILALAFTSGGILNPPAAYADETQVDTVRLAGDSRYLTAIEISKNNWFEAYNVVLARGDSFPDALAGAVLANSGAVRGPLLLTEPNSLRADVLQEIQRLNASTVYILGGTGAVSGNVENALKAKGLHVVRIEGDDRYETAANITASAVVASSQAFIASGENYADALSISAYAAAQGIPLLLTPKNQIPTATLEALHKLGVGSITLIGGENAISAAAKKQLEDAGYMVSRLSGDDRFQTNIQIMNTYPFDLNKVFIATGLAFPDALAGSVLAAKNNNPVVLVPKKDSQINGSSTASYLEENRGTVKSFFILGGAGAVNNKIAYYLQNGVFSPRVSLQFWDGYASKSTYEQILSYVPGSLSDSVQILVPTLAGSVQANGSFAYSFPNSSTPQYLVSLGQSKGAQVVPMVQATGQTANAILLDQDKRKTFADSAEKLVRETGADGILIDLEALGDNTGAGLTALMQDIYGRLSPQGKLVIISVMAKTSASWYKMYDYHTLAQYADYIQIMSYDYAYAGSAPGPVAPLDWVKKVMNYAVTQIPSEQILMGVPYYGRAWKQTGSNTWTSQAWGEAKAFSMAARYGVSPTRETTPTDPVGIPTFRYKDESGALWTVYFDDSLSWQAKFSLIDQYDLGGVGGWSMGWITDVSSTDLYPLLQQMT
jgi:putative cell wall-binding protein